MLFLAARGLGASRMIAEDMAAPPRRDRTSLLGAKTAPDGQFLARFRRRPVVPGPNAKFPVTATGCLAREPGTTARACGQISGSKSGDAHGGALHFDREALS